jgi:hypothetical protein
MSQTTCLAGVGRLPIPTAPPVSAATVKNSRHSIGPLTNVHELGAGEFILIEDTCRLRIPCGFTKLCLTGACI